MSTKKWTCGTDVISTGGFLRGGGGGASATGDDAGVSAEQPSFWDYAISGAVTIWHRTVIAALPSHSTIQYTYVVYSTIKIVLRIARVMVYSNINLGHFMAVFYLAFIAKTILSIAEFIVFLFKAWKSLIPIFGA